MLFWNLKQIFYKIKYQLLDASKNFPTNFEEGQGNFREQINVRKKTETQLIKAITYEICKKINQLCSNIFHDFSNYDCHFVFQEDLENIIRTSKLLRSRI